MPPDVCPQCGSLIPDRATSCPDCGADEDTGWNEAATAQRLGLPEDPDDFAYDQFVRDEFEEKPSNRLHPGWVLTAVMLLIALMAWFFW
jgi:RNA polymerase subunit RPABC4/transcription elongation factor Spt4